MIKKQEMYEIFYNYISNIINGSVDELKSDNTIFVKEPKKSGYVKILSIGDANIISSFQDIYSIVQEQLVSKNRDELYGPRKFTFDFFTKYFFLPKL